MSRYVNVRLSAWIFAILAAPSVHAAVVDPLDTTDGFFFSFGGVTATANGNSTVTLTRTLATADAGIDWMEDGTTRLPMDPDHNRLEIQPVAAVNGGYYRIHLLFFDSNGDYIAEPPTTNDDINDTSLQVVPDVAAFAADHGVSGAQTWFVRFRIQPVNVADVGFTFDSISVIPEPATLALAACGLALLLRRRGVARSSSV